MIRDNLSIIVFSKGRPMQMHAYLESLLKYSDAKEEMISVILCETDGIRYEKVKKTFPGVKWIQENNFEKDLKYAVQQANDYIMFGCDDVVFVHPFSLEQACCYLEKYEKVFGFSLRLGRNILPFPQKVAQNGKVIEWNWEETDAIGFDYPWELDCTVYRKTDVLLLIQEEKNAIKNPNFFEAIISEDNRKEKIMRKKMACFAQQGNAIVITVNRVQDSHPNGFDDSMLTDIFTLDKVYNDENNTLDIEKISQMKTNAIHVDAEFFVLRNEREGFEKKRVANKRLRLLKQKMIYAYKKCYNFVERRIYKKNLYLKSIEVMTPLETVKYLQSGKKSFVRFGADEFAFMQGTGVATQFYNKELASRLIQVFNTKEKEFRIAIPHHFIRYHQYTDFYEHCVLSVQDQRRYMKKICKREYTYLDEGISQVYQIYDGIDFEKFYTEWKNLFQEKEITVIIGEGILEKIEYNLLDVCSSVEYITIPNMNAYGKYETIINDVKKVDPNRIVCLIAGTTAKILAYDLYKMGYQAWDIGHLLKDYDAYMKSIERNKSEILHFYLPD